MPAKADPARFAAIARTVETTPAPLWRALVAETQDRYPDLDCNKADDLRQFLQALAGASSEQPSEEPALDLGERIGVQFEAGAVDVID